MAGRVAIIGAGYAGLACAVELARAGVPVTVFERSHTLGGRARVLAKDGWRLDNGQHILLGAYHELGRLMRLVGVSPKQLTHLPLTLLYPHRLELRAAALPAPLHLAIGLLRARGLSLADKLAAMRLLWWLRRRRFRLEQDMPVAALLAHTRQTQRNRELIWIPLCIAALNTPAETASAQVFANVLRDSLAAAAADSELLIPRIDLSDLFPVPAARYLATRRGQVRTTTPIEAIRPASGGYLLDGDPGGKPFAQVVIATAPYHVAALIDGLPGLERLRQQLDALDYEPIATVYLAYRPGVKLPAAMIGLADGPGQWAFDRDQLGGHNGLIAVVISAADLNIEREALIRAVHAQLARNLGQPLPEPCWTQLINEKRATFACKPGLDRPGVRSGLPGLWLVGDYIASDYPATLESAVRAGSFAAREILRAIQGQS